MKRYIQFKYNGNLETIDEMEINTREDKKELKELVRNYRLAYNVGEIYTSSRPCKNWRD
jgi:hypothetical protein